MEWHEPLAPPEIGSGASKGFQKLAARPGGAAWEQLEDLEEPLDPRYREEPWASGGPPALLADLPRLADGATRTGRPTSPLSWLLAISAIGLEECHYPRGPAGALRAGQR